MIPLRNGDSIDIPFVAVQHKIPYGLSWSDDDSESLVDVARKFVGSDDEQGVVRVFRIYQTHDPYVDSTALWMEKWYPYTCQGRHFPIMAFVLCPCQDIFWSRVSSKVKEDFWTERQLPAVEAIETINAIMEAVPLDCLEIAGLKNGATYEILYAKLLDHPRATKLQFSRYKVNDPRVIDLCCKLVANSTTLEDVHFENIAHFGRKGSLRLFQALRSNSNLKTLDLRSSRYLESWGKDHPGNEIRGIRTKRIQIEPLVEALLRTERPCPLEALDLGGNPILCTPAILSLAAALPSLKLQSLSLRGCCLNEKTLLAIVISLRKNHVLRHLDLSHNTLTGPIVERLIYSLKNNVTLQTLKMEHCSMHLDQAKSLAKSLSHIRYLKSLHIDGNEFAWEPVSKEGESLGAVLLLESLERNKSLVSLRMGESGKLAPYSISCCTAPPYSLALNQDNREKFSDLLRRNAKL